MKPIVDANSTSAPATAATPPANHRDNTLPIAGGALALLAAGGAAYALSRRRRHEDEEEWIDDGSTYEEPASTAMMEDREPATMVHEEQPAMVAPAASAFAWGNEPRREEQRTEEPMVEDERNPGESWIERAYRGPSPSNPSVSLKARLKRAAFFDKRERDAAAGVAEPVDTTAGLPDALVEEQQSELA